MSVRIRKMTEAEYEYFYQWSVEQHTRELMEELQLSKEDAFKETLEEVSEMLPDGINTQNNYLMSIVESETEEVVGFIWTLHEEYEGRKQSFICDLAIWEPRRRKGYAEETLYLTQKNAQEAGCQESLLFVNDVNKAAEALYVKCGYEILRQESYGKFMIKQFVGEE